MFSDSECVKVDQQFRYALAPIFDLKSIIDAFLNAFALMSNGFVLWSVDYDRSIIRQVMFLPRSRLSPLFAICWI